MNYIVKTVSKPVTLSVIAAFALVTFGGVVMVADGASASPRQVTAVRNDNIKISRAGLKGKCQRSGGTFFSNEKNGTYMCTVKKDDGGSTIVGCAENEKCSGITTTPK